MGSGGNRMQARPEGNNPNLTDNWDDAEGYYSKCCFLHILMFPLAYKSIYKSYEKTKQSGTNLVFK